MPKVKLAEWCDRWKHGNPEESDFFSITGSEEKEASDEMIMLAMGRLVRVDGGQIIPPVKKNVEKGKKQIER
jgi:hypothetical protein